MKATIWAVALVASALPASARLHARRPPMEHDVANPWAVANPWLDKPATYANAKKSSVSPDGTCGGSNGYSCKGSAWGDCCNKLGWCGSSEDFCGTGCNTAFGLCGAAGASSSAIEAVTASSVPPRAHGKVTVTAITTISTTICPTTMVVTVSGTTSESTWMTTSLVTTTLPYSTVTVTEHPSGYPSSEVQSSPEASGYSSLESSISSETSPTTEAPSTSTVVIGTTLTQYTTVITTTTPVTKTIVSSGSTSLTTYATVSTVTSLVSSTATVYSTVTVSTLSVYPSLSLSETSAPVSSPVATATTVSTTIYTTLCPVTDTVTSSGTTSLSTYTTVSTVTSVLSSTVTSYGTESSSQVESTPSETTVTAYTTTYTTTCPVTETVTSSGITSETVYTTVSTVTSVISSPVASSLSSSGSAHSFLSSTPIYRTDSCFTTTINGTVTTISTSPTSAITSEAPNTSTSGAVVTTNGTTSTVATPGFSNISSTAITPGHTFVSSSCIYRAGSCFTTSTNGSYSVPYPTGSSGLSRPSSGSSLPYPGNNSTVSRPVGSGTGAPTSTASHGPSYSGNSTTPIGPTATRPPFSTGTGGSSYASNSMNATRTSTSSSSTCMSKPTNTDWCIPCDDQPSNDPDQFCGYTVNDDSYKVTPKTCRTVEYDFTVTNTTVAPDGVERLGLLINGQFPGPTIEANWGDTIVVHLTNGLQNNGTSLHFHGMRQLYTNEMDGVPSITQCALAPGDSMTYTFVAENYGTSWYHSHWGLQTYDGIFGPMVIHGPASKDYDEDLGPVILQDWNHVSVNELYGASQQVTASGRSGPPTLDTGLINGKNVWDNGGSRTEFNFESGKAYLLRVVNCAIEATFKLSLDGHKFWVISNDFVPIVPYQTDVLNINIGQRYNIIVVADQPVGDYWMRADNQVSCSPMTNYDDIKAIVRYQGSLGGTPITTPNANATQGACVDEPLASLVPVVAHQVGAEDREVTENVVVGPGPNTPTLFKWTLNGATFQSQWGDPTLLSIARNGTIPPYSGSLAIEAPNLGEWIYIIIESSIPVPHPIHLHGHDFYVVGAGAGLWDGDYSALNLVNPPRRDVAMMPGNTPSATNPRLGGHLVVAFYTDNPGAWLMHCHIGWHAEMGFALQIVENQAGIEAMNLDTCVMEETCKKWNSYATANNVVVSDSGI